MNEKIESFFGIVDENPEINVPVNSNVFSTNVFIPMNGKLTDKSFFYFSGMIKLINTFDITESGWGLDILWSKLLGYPTDKIAIIDSVTIEHTSPVGKNYGNRFSKSPMDELHDVMRKYSVGFVHKEYSKIF
jgi:hypothetical protein